MIFTTVRSYRVEVLYRLAKAFDAKGCLSCRGSKASLVDNKALLDNPANMRTALSDIGCGNDPVKREDEAVRYYKDSQLQVRIRRRALNAFNGTLF